MDIPGMKRIEDGKTASDEAILEAIDLAGAYIAAINPPHRKHHTTFSYSLPASDFGPGMVRETARLSFAWVKPQDIGRSTRENRHLLNRLEDMVSRGLLEKRYLGNLPAFRRTGR